MARSTYRRSPAQQAEADARREELLGKLTEGIDKLADSEEWQRYLDCQSKFHRYSFGNCLLILAQHPAATQVASFRKWQEVGRQVNKGETSLRIFAPSVRKVERETEEGTEQTKAVTGFRFVPVFDVSQTSGEELPQPVKLLEGEAPEGVFGKLTKVAESIGFSVQVTPEVDSHPGANGLCSYSDKVITVANAGRSTSQQVKTLAHEIGHAMLHGDREAMLTRSTVELEAESVAYVTCQQLGLTTEGYSFGYVLGWSHDKPEIARERIKASGARIHQASQKILDCLELQAEKSEAQAECDVDIEAA